MSEKKLIHFVSVYRFLALIIVLYYHLVIIPTYSLEVVMVTNGTLSEPITPGNVLGLIGMYIYNTLHVDAGSLAVIMFFIASGYLASTMMDRYSRKEYLVNRVLSTFPTLWASIIIIAVTVFISQDIKFTLEDLLVSAFPIWPRNSGVFVSAVLWTLRIELKFYLLVAIFGKNRKNLIFYGYALILFLSIAFYEFQVPWLYAQMYDLQFMTFAFLGVIIECVQRENHPDGVKYVSLSVLFNILLFKISAWIFQDGASRMSYPNVATQVLPVVLFLLLMKVESRFPKLYQVLPKFVYSSGKLMLPLYLTHTACGISVMLQMSLRGSGPYLTLLCGVVASFIVAGAIYLLITKPSHIWMKKAIAAMRRSH